MLANSKMGWLNTDQSCRRLYAACMKVVKHGVQREQCCKNQNWRYVNILALIRYIVHMDKLYNQLI